MLLPPDADPYAYGVPLPVKAGVRAVRLKTPRQWILVPLSADDQAELQQDGFLLLRLVQNPFEAAHGEMAVLLYTE